MNMKPVTATGALALASLLALSARGEAPVDYHADIVPLLRDYCAGCHNDYDREAGLSVETYGSLMQGGESDEFSSIVPGDIEKSYLLQTVLRKADPAMPPEEEPQMSEEEISLFARWVEQGAQGPSKEEDESLLATLMVPEIEPQTAVKRPVTAMEFSPDGKWLALGRFGTVEVQRADGRKTFRVLTGLPGKVKSVHFSPDGSRLVAASGVAGLRGVAVVFDLASGEKVLEVGDGSHHDLLYDAEFSPDGSYLATAGYDRVIRLWESDTGRYVRKFPSHNGAVYDLSFTPDAKILLSASHDGTGKVWDVESGVRLDTLNQPQAEQFRITSTPDGRHIVAAGADNRIRLWRLVSTDRPKINPVLHARFAHEDAIGELALSRDGRFLATASADRALRLWSLPDVKLMKDFPLQPDIVSSLAFSPDGTELLVARLDGTLERYPVDAESKREGNGGPSYTVVEEASTTIPTGEMVQVEEVESPGAQTVTAPVEIAGAIATPGDTDLFRFTARKGEEWILEVDAEGSKSKLDSLVEVLDAEGNPVERVVLQAVRDSWFTFRGKDSNTSDDFRVHNWREMELNDYLYANGEVVKLWHYPRGPDSGFKVYPGFGKRRGYFDTTPKSQALGAPCYIVNVLPAGSDPSPNGLPVYRLFYENDDDAWRRLGKDSKLTFVAPADGDYLARISDVRGFGGEGHHYTLAIRAPRPDFSLSVGGKNPAISPGSGKEISFTAMRQDGFAGPISIEIADLPAGFTASSPIVIEREQDRAYAVIRAEENAVTPDEETWKKVRITARATIRGKAVSKDLGDLGTIKAADPAKLLVSIHPDGDSGRVAEDGVLTFDIESGETISAMVRAKRSGFDERVEFGKDDSGRNLPHGVYVDNIGLNGLMIPAGRSEQRFFMTAAPWVSPAERLFHLQTNAAGKQASQAVRIRVIVPDDAVAASRRP